MRTALAISFLVLSIFTQAEAQTMRKIICRAEANGFSYYPMMVLEGRPSRSQVYSNQSGQEFLIEFDLWWSRSSDELRFESLAATAKGSGRVLEFRSMDGAISGSVLCENYQTVSYAFLSKSGRVFDVETPYWDSKNSFPQIYQALINEGQVCVLGNPASAVLALKSSNDFWPRNTVMETSSGLEWTERREVCVKEEPSTDDSKPKCLETKTLPPVTFKIPRCLN